LPGKAFDAPRRFAEVQARIEESNAVALAGAGKVRSLIAQHREAIQACTTHESFAAAVNRLIADIGPSHFHYYTDDDWEYWHLRAAFGGGSAKDHIEHVGIIPERIGHRWFIQGVLEGSPADGKGIEVGDEILSVDGMPYAPVSVFRGTAGRNVKVQLRRRPQMPYEVELTPKKESLYTAMQQAIRESIETIEHNGRTFVYMHGWTLLGNGDEYEKLLELQAQVDGLVLDYRDGFGGTWHRAERFLANVSGDDVWTKPLVILTGEGTRSAKEIVVYGVKKEGRAPLVGEPTPGHVIAVGGVVEIGDDALLMLPGFPFELEGKPIQPDFLVSRDIRYCGGDDPQLDFAKDLLGSLVAREESGKTTRSWDDAVLSLPNVTRAP
jgi:carboxyl-terminal processing protease